MDRLRHPVRQLPDHLAQQAVDAYCTSHEGGRVENDKSSIYLNAFDLWGIVAIFETFIFVGKSPLKFYSIPDVLDLMPLFFLLQQ